MHSLPTQHAQIVGASLSEHHTDEWTQDHACITMAGSGTQGAAPAAVSSLHQPADVREGLANVVTTVSEELITIVYSW